MRMVLATRTSIALAAAVALLAGMPQASAQGTPSAGADLAPPTDFPVESFVQTASSARLEANPDSSYTLVLEGAEPSVAFLAGAERQVGRVPADLFLSGGGGDQTPLPPDSARAILSADGIDDLEVELSEPSYEAQAGTVSYQARFGFGQPVPGPSPLSNPRITIESPAISCSRGQATCNWVVQECERFFDPPICQTLGPIVSETNFGTASWGRYYCGCDTKCYPDSPPEPCFSDQDVIAFNCQNRFGAQGCPAGKVCYWRGTNTKGTGCGAKCCGGFCGPFKKC